MYHILYKSYLPSGKYYVGRHSTENLNDSYVGSGTWIRSLSPNIKSQLIREILSFHESFEELKKAEALLIETVLNDPLNMNFNNSPCGFAVGDLNPSRQTDSTILSERIKGSKNGMFGKKHSDETKQKMSEANKGKTFLHTEESKQKMRNAIRPKWSQEAKNSLSKKRKEEYKLGLRKANKSFSGKTHTEETIRKMKETSLNRERITCPHCGKISAVNLYSRWHGDNCKSII